MTQREINTLNMIDGTLIYMEKHKDIWQNEAPIVKSMEYITSRRNNISAENKQLTESGTEGITAVIHAGLDKAVTIAALMATRLVVFANSTENLVLLKEVDYKESNLANGPFNKVMARLELIAKRGQEHLPELGTYKVKPADIDALLAAIADIKNKPAVRKSTTGERIESTAAAKLMLKEISLQLKKGLDREVTALIENEEIVNGYFAVRRIDDRKGRGPGKNSEDKV